MKSTISKNKNNLKNNDHDKKDYVECYNCRSNNYTYFDTEFGYDLVKCCNCGLLYVNPRPSEEYITNASRMGMHKNERIKNVTGKYHRNKVKIYHSVLADLYPGYDFNGKNLKWLDIGCGFGEFIEAVETYSKGHVKASGIDPNLEKINSAKNRGLNVKSDSLENINEKYDFISLLNVYSHLPDPVKFLDELVTKLNTNGELLLQTGDVSHLPRKYHPKPYDLPDHLSFANKDIVISILENAGFEILNIRLYRASIYPKYYELIKILKLFVKIIIRRGERIDFLYPRYPDIDMYVRCRLK